MAETVVRIEGVDAVNNALPVSGSLTTTPSGTQNVAITSPTTFPIKGGSTTATTTLSAVTTGTGTAIDFGTAMSGISMAILVSGTVTAGAVALDVSQDGTNWVMINVSATLVSNTNVKLASSNEAWRYARGRVTTNVTGGATVTCTMMSWG